MKYFIPLIAVLFCPIFVFCQDIAGLWKGTLYNDSTHQSYQYEIVINKEKGKYTGYSQTWYLVNDKKVYGIKKIKVSIARDGKIVMQDDKLVANNYPIAPPKDVFQLNVLDLSVAGAESMLDGPFVTNRSKRYNALAGRISLHRVDQQLSESDLTPYINKDKEGSDNTLTLVK